MLVILGTAHGSNVKGKRSPDERLLEYKWSREMCYLIQGGLNEKFNNLLFNTEDKFLHYLISYSTHTPFAKNKGKGV